MNAIAHASTAPAGPKLDNRRVLAGLIDLVIIAAGGFALGTLAALATGGKAAFSGQMRPIMVAWALYYYFALESGGGQTVGKRLMRLRVVRADGAPAGMGEIAVRTILRVVDGLFAYLVGLIVMLATGERRQRLGDLAAGTMVADASAPPGGPDAATAEPAAEQSAGSFAAPQREAMPGPSTPVHGPTRSRISTPPAITDLDIHSLMQPQPQPQPEPQPEREAEVLPFEPASGQPDEPAAEQAAAEPAARDPFEPDQPLGPEDAADQPLTHGPTEVPAPEVREEPDAEPSFAPEPVEESAFAPMEWSFAPEPVEESAAAPAEQSFAPEPVEEPTPQPTEWSFAPEPVEESAPAPTEQSFAPEPVEERTPGPVAEEPIVEPADQLSERHEQPEEDVNVHSVETVSAIDLVMGGDEESDESSEDDDGRQPQPQ